MIYVTLSAYGLDWMQQQCNLYHNNIVTDAPEWLYSAWKIKRVEIIKKKLKLATESNEEDYDAIEIGSCRDLVQTNNKGGYRNEDYESYSWI